MRRCCPPSRSSVQKCSAAVAPGQPGAPLSHCSETVAVLSIARTSSARLCACCVLNTDSSCCKGRGGAEGRGGDSVALSLERPPGSPHASQSTQTHLGGQAALQDVAAVYVVGVEEGCAESSSQAGRLRGVDGGQPELQAVAGPGLSARGERVGQHLTRSDGEQHHPTLWPAPGLAWPPASRPG